MPRVPVLPGPEETPRPLPDPYPSIPIPAGLGREGTRLTRLGAAVGSLGSSAGALLARRAAELRDEDAAARATQAFAAFKAEAAPLFHDPEQGFFALPGGAAYPQLLPLTRRFAEIEKKHHQGLEDPAERRLYESLAFPWAERMSEAAARKAAQARPLWLDEASTVRLQGALDEAAIAYTDPERIDDLLSSGIAELARMKTRNRWDDARFKETAAGFLTLGHAGVVERMLQSGDFPAARAHYESNRGLLTEDGRRQIEGRLGAAEIAGKAQAEAGDLYARGLDRSAALEATQGIDDPILRQRTAGELEPLYDRAQGERKRAEQDRRDTAWQSIEKGGAVLDLAPELRDGLDAETLSSLKAWSRSTLTGEPVKTDPAIWSRLKAMDPADLAAEDLRRWRGGLSKEDYRELAELSRAAADGDEAGRARVLQARVFNRAFLNRLRAHGIEPASADAAGLRRRVEDDLALHQHSTGRAPDPEVIRDAVEELGDTAGEEALLGGSDIQKPGADESLDSTEEKLDESLPSWPTNPGTNQLFNKFLPRLLEREGEKASDRGGPTKKGISQRLLNDIHRPGSHPEWGLPSQTGDLTQEQIEGIYWQIFFRDAHIQELANIPGIEQAAPPLVEQVFDAGVLHDFRVAGRWLQESLDNAFGTDLRVKNRSGQMVYQGTIGPRTRGIIQDAINNPQKREKLKAVNDDVVKKRVREMKRLDPEGENKGWIPRAESFLTQNYKPASE